MKKILFPLLLICLQFNVNGATDQKFCNLMLVNSEWKNQPDAANVLANTSFPKPDNFNEWIATHLMLVEKTLRARNVNHLSALQQTNRFKLLDALNGYWHAGIFPVNDYLLYKNPVFIDRKGTHCAVGYLMMQSGNDDLAKRIDFHEKFAYVRQITTEGVANWANENGFTINELAWIQPGYPPATSTDDLEGGLNGSVNTMAVDNVTQTVYAAGAFSTTGKGILCNNIAAYISGFAGYDWIPVGNGVNGTVHTMIINNNKIYMGGEFSMAGALPASRVAVYDLSNGQWSALGSLDSTVRSLVFYNNELYAGGNFSGFVSKWNGTQWINITSGFIYGEGVTALHVFNNQLVIGGNFECATGAIRKHIATYNGVQMGVLGYGTVTPVNDLETHNTTLFAACKFVSGSDTCALASYENGNWITRVKMSNELASSFSGDGINSLVSTSGLLLAGGNFDCGTGMTYGSNLAELSKAQWGDTTLYHCMPLTITDAKVNALAALSGTLYFGGNFNFAGMGDTANHIAALQLTPSSVAESKNKKPEVRVYPNPVTDILQFEMPEGGILNAQITDLSGKQLLILNEIPFNCKIVAKSLSGGMYVLRIQTNKGWVNTRFVKN